MLPINPQQLPLQEQPATAQRRPLGGSDVMAPPLGVGTASWGERLLGYGRTHSRKDLMRAYSACLDEGFDFFDTAEGYGHGDAERILGECRREDGRPVTIATKYAPAHMFAPSISRLRPCALFKGLDASLERLGVERIDLYQIHFPTSPASVDGLMDKLAEAVRIGKVRAVGVSNYGVALMRRAHARLALHGIPLASNQVHYNLLNRRPEVDGVLNACRELNVSLIAYSPLQQGVLSGKYRNPELSPSFFQQLIFRLGQLGSLGEIQDRSPIYKRIFAKPRCLQRDKLEYLFVVLEQVAQAHQKSIGQVALNWLISGEEHVIPIPGAKNSRQAAENAAVASWRLTEEERELINRAEIASR
jgi:aryl-alcohol dehydrogenase-like predicted oxidoreductase